MENKSRYKLLVGSITILAGILSIASIVVGAYAVEFNFDAFSEPVLVLKYAHNYAAAYWFLILDLAGYYLLLLPVIFYLHQQYKFQSPWTQLYTFSGLAYVLTGAIGAAILASAWPQLMQQHLVAPSTDQQSVQLIFSVITQVVTKGLWNILEVLFAACWWIGFGTLLIRDNKVVGILSLVAGIACFIDAIGNIWQWKVLSETGVNIYLVMGILWPIWLGIRTIRQSVSSSGAYGKAYTSSTIKEPAHALD